jgi:uncharacterized protein YkwD
MTKFTRLMLIGVASALVGALFLPAWCVARMPAQTENKSSILSILSQVRVVNGLAPLALNPALEKAAQEHSDDMARKGYVDHVGSDGSSPEERIYAAGYPAWSSLRVAGEIVYAGNKGFSEALTYLLDDDAQKRVLLNNHFREIGIGFTSVTNADGGQTTYWTLTFGAQPNVLPIFINDGVTLINMPQVAIHLTQEDAVLNGENSAMGSALEIRVSSDSTFKGVNWQKWEALVPYTFDKMPGLKTVYVQFRDGGGRTTISTVSVQYDPNSTPQVQPVGPGAQVASTLAVTDTLAESTPTPFVTMVSVATPVAVTRIITPVAQVTAIVLVVSPPPQEEPIETPVPSTTPSSRTLVDRPDAVLPDWLFPLYLFTQGVVVALGAVAFFRMKR